MKDVKREHYTVVYNNKLIIVARSMRELAIEMGAMGKSHIWYSRRFLNTDHFFFVHGDHELYSFQKVTI